MGLALVERLVAEAIDVHVWDVSGPGSSGVAGSAVDLADRAAVIDAAACIAGDVTTFVHCAGVHLHTDVDDSDALAQITRSIAVHVNGFVNGVQALLPQLRRTRGSIVAVSSLGASHVYPTSLAYGTSKAALERAIVQFAVELGPDGIRVNGISPGPIRTPMTESIWSDPEKFKDRVQRIPLRRPGEPGDVAELIRFLASEAASFITGTITPIDGGFSRAMAYGVTSQ
jgi:NAD(P)-dependent dehydrogenase (short-subunit alcohol dehydrogenase family)